MIAQLDYASPCVLTGSGVWMLAGIAGALVIGVFLGQWLNQRP